MTRLTATSAFISSFPRGRRAARLQAGEFVHAHPAKARASHRQTLALYPVLPALRWKLPQAETVDENRMTPLRRLIPHFAALLAMAAATTMAQTAAPQGVIRNGVVSLGILPQTSATANLATSTATAVAPPPAGAFGGRSGSAAAATDNSGQSSTGVPASGNVPAWLTCPPSGASGIAPFLAGTDLSCAP
jgi:hypothetical protein